MTPTRAAICGRDLLVATSTRGSEQCVGERGRPMRSAIKISARRAGRSCWQHDGQLAQKALVGYVGSVGPGWCAASTPRSHGEIARGAGPGRWGSGDKSLPEQLHVVSSSAKCPRRVGSGVVERVGHVVEGRRHARA